MKPADKRVVDISRWERKEHYEFFGNMPDPFFGLTVKVDFSDIKHAGGHRTGDSIPEVAVGKLHEENGRMVMSVSIEVNHGLADGRHIGLFVDALPTVFQLP